MEYLHSLAIDEAALPPREFEELCRLRPDGRKPAGLRIDVVTSDPQGDQFVRSAIEIAEGHGLVRRYHSGASSYGYHVARLYDQSDLDSAEILFLERQKKIQGLTKPERDDRGRLVLVSSNARPSLRIGRIFPNWIIVSDGVRRLLESGGFTGLRFCEVAQTGKSMHAAQDPFWELRSSITLPRMANAHQFIHPGLTETEPFRGDYSKTVIIREDPFDTGEIHYRSCDLAAVGGFDIATTFEIYMEPHQGLVISQRFYRYCLAQNIPLAVRPVRIDP